MANYIVKGESLTAVADAIREKTGTTEPLGLVEMPEAIRNIQAGDDEGSYDQGFADGKQAEYDAFWDVYQQNGNRTDYSSAFAGVGWRPTNFKPKYNLTVKNAYMMFYAYGYDLDLVEHLNSHGLTMKTTDCTNFQYTFNYSSVAHIGELDVTKVTRMQNAFANTYKLHTIDKIISSENTSYSTGTFGECSLLENVVFEGVIGVNFDIHWSTKLTHDSLMSIINALKDYSGSGSTCSVTLGSENLAKLTDAEKMQAVNKGWTLVGWTPPQWNEGDTCEHCNIEVLDENGRCPACGYSVPAGKRICYCGGDIDENCVCVSCGTTYHATEGPICYWCDAELCCPECGEWTGGTSCPNGCGGE